MDKSDMKPMQSLEDIKQDLMRKLEVADKEISRLQTLLSQMVDLNREQEAEFTERITTLLDRSETQGRVASAVMAIIHQKQKPVPHLYGADDDEMTKITEEVIKYVTYGCDFEVIVGAIQENPLIASEWERFTSFLRLAEE